LKFEFFELYKFKNIIIMHHIINNGKLKQYVPVFNKNKKKSRFPNAADFQSSIAALQTCIIKI
jgi:hypothetical protein